MYRIETHTNQPKKQIKMKEVITVRLSKEDKKLLEDLAKTKRLPLGSFIRSEMIKQLNN